MNIRQVIAISLWLILGASRASAAEEASSDPLIPLNVSGENLGKILGQLGSAYDYNFVCSPELCNRPGPHMSVAPMPAPRAFALLAAAYGACAVGRGTVVLFKACDDGYQPHSASAVDQPVEEPKVAL